MTGAAGGVRQTVWQEETDMSSRMYVPSDECRKLAHESYEQGQRDALESLIEAFDTLGMTAAAGATRQALTQLPQENTR